MVILINGPINAGKTTVSKAIARLLPNTAHVEVDDLGEFVRWMPLAQSIPLNLENAAAVTSVFVRHGLNVVVSYPLSANDHAFLLERLSGLGRPVHTFNLAVPLEVLLADRGERLLEERERRRILEMRREGLLSPPFGVTVDNHGQPPDETAHRVLALAGFAAGSINP